MHHTVLQMKQAVKTSLKGFVSCSHWFLSRSGDEGINPNAEWAIQPDCRGTSNGSAHSPAAAAPCGRAATTAKPSERHPARSTPGRRTNSAAETNLLKSAFSTDPAKPGQPRLRLHPNDGSDTFKSLHAGAGAFAHGCYAALRNPGSHDPQDELPQDQALEQLAAFSILARWIDQAELER